MNYIRKALGYESFNNSISSVTAVRIPASNTDSSEDSDISYSDKSIETDPSSSSSSYSVDHINIKHRDRGKNKELTSVQVEVEEDTNHNSDYIQNLKSSTFGFDDDFSTERDTIFGGIITNMEEGMRDGIVDRFYRFSQKKFGTTFRLGDMVNFVAEQDPQFFEWRIKEMSHFVSEAELQIQENAKYFTFIFQIVHIDNETQLATARLPGHDDTTINTSFLTQDYEVKVGDFLEAKTVSSDDNPLYSNLKNLATGKFLSIKPSKRKRVVNGNVVENNGQLCIDYHILITSEFCTDKGFPELGTLVNAEAVECSQENDVFRWRVISISQSEFSKYAEEEGDDWDAKDSLSDEVRDYIDKLLEDKGGLLITPLKGIDFGVIREKSFSEKVINILNSSSRAYTLQNVEIANDQRVCKFEFKFSRIEGPGTIAVLEPGDSIDIKITCTPLLNGRTRELCKFNFGEFCIGRYATAKSVPSDNNTMELLNKDKAGRKDIMLRDIQRLEYEKRVAAFSNKTRVPGISAVRRRFFLPHYLPPNRYPKQLYNALKENDPKQLFEIFPNLKGSEPNKPIELSFESYQNLFHTALWFEEIDRQLKRDRLTLCTVTLIRSGDSMYFEVSNLQDFEPSLKCGDGISVCDAEFPEGKIFDASVNKIIDNNVFCKFDCKFQEEYKGNLMTVRFRFGRTTFIRCHYAIDKAINFLGENWLFPTELEVKSAKFTFLEGDNGSEDTEEDGSKPLNLVFLHKKKSRIRPNRNSRTLDMRAHNQFPLAPDPLDLSDSAMSEQVDVSQQVKLNWYNRNLNEEQKNAVRRILRGQCRPLPYVLFGPPGTGKTVTIVEAIMQINKLDKKSRILVTAPSNAAADLIAEYLVASGKFRPGDFVRFNGYQRAESTIPDAISDFCFDGENLQNIARNRIIISTCNNAGQFFEIGITAGHFSHVFLDEAGYCHEPDSIINALFVSLDRKGQYILAGDPMQLGPVLFCNIAKSTYGLEISLLERLMNTPLYQRDQETNDYNPLLLTKLLKNYRSHELLLKLPSKLFYDDELVFAAPENTTESLCLNLDFMPTRGVPLIFHGLRGDQEKDLGCPSWYNTLEVFQVVEYVKKMMSNGCTAEDIGIITPYRKQVEKISQGIRKILGCQMPKVGSVQEFQGGEKKIIILSLVRSKYSEDELDIPVNKFNFLFSPKRFNVSITRAKAILVVIGDPHLFRNCPEWFKFIKYCVELEAYVGCELPIQLNTQWRKSLRSNSRSNQRT